MYGTVRLKESRIEYFIKEFLILLHVKYNNLQPIRLITTKLNF